MQSLLYRTSFFARILLFLPRQDSLTCWWNFTLWAPAKTFQVWLLWAFREMCDDGKFSDIMIACQLTNTSKYQKYQNAKILQTLRKRVLGKFDKKIIQKRIWYIERYTKCFSNNIYSVPRACDKQCRTAKNVEEKCLL